MGDFPPVFLLYSIRSTHVAKVDHSLATKDVLLKNLKANLEVACNKMKQMAD